MSISRQLLQQGSTASEGPAPCRACRPSESLPSSCKVPTTKQKMDKPRCAQPLQATPDAFLQSSDTKGCNQQLDKASLQEIFDSADVAVDGELDIVSEENRSPEHAGSPVTVEETRLRARCMALQALAEDLRTEALQLRGHALVDCSTEELYHLAKTLEKASKRVAHVRRLRASAQKMERRGSTAAPGTEPVSPARILLKREAERSVPEHLSNAAIRRRLSFAKE